MIALLHLRIKANTIRVKPVRSKVAGSGTALTVGEPICIFVRWGSVPEVITDPVAESIVMTRKLSARRVSDTGTGFIVPSRIAKENASGCGLSVFVVMFKVNDNELLKGVNGT